MMRLRVAAAATALVLGAAFPGGQVLAQGDGSGNQPMLISVKRMSLETALHIARAALDECRHEGLQVGVTVVDRSGQTQVVLRDELAPPLTLTVSRQKAYTAVSFNSPTSALVDRFKSPNSVGKVPGLVFSAGGVPIEAGGTLLGAVGVSGAPQGTTDEKCARAGVDAVKADLEMQGM
ncbi:MAG: heme-binding protein [Gammaproteobacteria bacterium]